MCGSKFVVQAGSLGATVLPKTLRRLLLYPVTEPAWWRYKATSLAIRLNASRLVSAHDCMAQARYLGPTGPLPLLKFKFDLM